ncbi:hypothetical protein F5Y08DRAFT_38959 [Xylaria arbuscula]|nr:hypothetical protein F5Y08DRAFT_38959 [Xylaria arbuscula]
MSDMFASIIAFIRGVYHWICRLAVQPPATNLHQGNVRPVIMAIQSLQSDKPCLSNYKDLPDMSTRSHPGQIVNVTVGPESRIFQVHMSRIEALAKLVDGKADESSASIHLPKESPETFNVLVNWMYGEPLPRAAKTSDRTDQSASLIPIPKKIKELPYLTWLDDATPKDELEKAAQSDEELETAHATQCMLLDLMMFAERHEWEVLYNAAVDAFRAGEANLERDRPSLLHLEVAYRRTAIGSPIRELLSDYAWTLAKQNKNITRYWNEGLFRKIPEFLEDMLKRVDGNGPFKYPFEHREAEEVVADDYSELRYLAQEAPLDLAETTYHLHDGRLRLDCRRSSEGLCMLE